MTLRSANLIATALTLTLMPMAALADGVWQGSWDTNYPDLNLTQEGQLVYGEYEGRGWIVGLTDASGSILRGAWAYDSGRLGALEFRMQPGGAAFVGEWAEEVTSFPYGSGTAWTGTRQTLVPGYTADFNGQIAWPDQFDFNDPSVLAWLGNGQGAATPVTPVNPVTPVSPTPAAPISPVTTDGQCPEVPFSPGLSASNNPFVTPSGITDPTSAYWTIYGQPPAAPLGSMAFTSAGGTLRFEACIPMFGRINAPTRRNILIERAEMTQTANGDWQGWGGFTDAARGEYGEVALYLTNPATGQGLAALTISDVEGNGNWAESVLLDYSAD